jgi:hypothetical protein
MARMAAAAAAGGSGAVVRPTAELLAAACLQPASLEARQLCWVSHLAQCSDTSTHLWRIPPVSLFLLPAFVPVAAVTRHRPRAVGQENACSATDQHRPCVSLFAHQPVYVLPATPECNGAMSTQLNHKRLADRQTDNKQTLRQEGGLSCKTDKRMGRQQRGAGPRECGVTVLLAQAGRSKCFRRPGPPAGQPSVHLRQQALLHPQ